MLLGLQRAGDVPAAMAIAITRELTLVGSFRFADEIDDVLAALADGSLAVDRHRDARVPGGERREAFAVAADASRSSKVLLDFGARHEGRAEPADAAHRDAGLRLRRLGYPATHEQPDSLHPALS